MLFSTKLKIFISICFFSIGSSSFSQTHSFKHFVKLSSPEKWWVIWHPFVAKKALKTTLKARKVTQEVIQDSVLIGGGNGQQVDAFRHTYWMLTLAQVIGSKKAKKLGVAHEKGNYKDFKKRKNEDGVVPDKISSEMDLYNNSVGIKLALKSKKLSNKELVILAVREGACIIIKTDLNGNYLSCDGSIISHQYLKGKWENSKCLISSKL